MTVVSISKELKNIVPELTLSCIECNVLLESKNEFLWKEIRHKVADIQDNILVEEISKLPSVASSRKAYRNCGKDPARYRLSAEALLRRVVKQKDIFQINNVVDLLNLVSISTGFSIGGYDPDKIQGDVIFGIGREGEFYEGIGRGVLNIGCLPVFRDDLGAFGSPTSDSIRTAVTMETTRFLMIIIDFGAYGGLHTAASLSTDLLEKYAGATNLVIQTIA